MRMLMKRKRSHRRNLGAGYIGMALIAGGAGFAGNNSAFSLWFFAITLLVISGPICLALYACGTYVEPAGLRCRPVSGRPVVYPWREIEGFVLKDSPGLAGKHICVQVGGRLVPLPGARWKNAELHQAEQVYNALLEDSAPFLGVPRGSFDDEALATSWPSPKGA